MIKIKFANSIEAPRTVSTAVNSASIDVGGMAGDSLAITLIISSASSPGTASAVLQGSLNNTDFASIGTPTTITANGVVPFTQDRPPYRYYRIAYAIASGSFVSTSLALIKSDR